MMFCCVELQGATIKIAETRCGRKPLPTRSLQPSPPALCAAARLMAQAAAQLEALAGTAPRDLAHPPTLRQLYTSVADAGMELYLLQRRTASCLGKKLLQTAIELET